MCSQKTLLGITFAVLAAPTIQAQTFTVPITSQFVAMYGAAASYSIPANAWTIMNFDTVEADSNNAVTTGSNWTFTSPETAYVDVRTCVQWSSVTPGAGFYSGIAIFKNGVYYKQLCNYYEWVALGYGINPTMEGSTIVRCQQGDTLNLRIYQNSSTSGTTFASVDRCWITISCVH